MNATILALALSALCDAPPLTDLDFLPSRETVRRARHFSLDYQENLRMQAMVRLHRREEFWEIKRETDQLYRIWDTLDDAQIDCRDVVFRREKLRCLRDLLGAEAYYSGRMPPTRPPLAIRLDRGPMKGPSLRPLPAPPTRPLILPAEGSPRDYRLAADLAARLCLDCGKPIGRGVLFWFVSYLSRDLVHSACIRSLQRRRPCCK